MVHHHKHFFADTLYSLDLLCFFHIYPERLNHGWSQLSALYPPPPKQLTIVGVNYPIRLFIFCKFKTTNLKWAVCYNVLCFPSQLSLLLSEKTFPQTGYTLFFPDTSWPGETERIRQERLTFPSTKSIGSTFCRIIREETLVLTHLLKILGVHE